MLISWVPDPDSTADAYNVYVSVSPFNANNLPSPTQVANTETSLDVPETSAYVRVGAVQGDLVRLSALYKTADLPNASIFVGNVSVIDVLGSYSYGCEFSPDGAYLAIAQSESANANGGDGLIVLNTSDWSQLSAGGPVMAADGTRCRFSPDGAYLALVHKNAPGLTIFNTSDWSIVSGTPTLGTSEAKDCAFSPDGSHLVVVSPDQAALLLDTADWTIVSGVDLPQADCCEFSPDGSYLAIGEQVSGDALKVFRTSDWSRTTASTSEGYCMDVTFSPDGEYLAVCYDYTSKMVILRTSDWSIYHEFTGLPDSPKASAFSPDGGYLVTALDNGGSNISVLNMDSLAAIETGLTAARYGKECAFSPDGSYLAITSRDNDGTKIIGSV